MNSDGVKDILLFGGGADNGATAVGDVEIHILREKFWRSESL